MKESRTVKMLWTVTAQGVQATIPAGEQIEVWRDPNAGLRVAWSGFHNKQLGFSAPVTEEDLAAHT
jgi:hypothetical protein